MYIHLQVRRILSVHDFMEGNVEANAHKNPTHITFQH